MIENTAISVVMCTYNGEKYLSQQLDSILHQTYPCKELIIVDDVSTDATWEILQTYQQKYKHISIYKNETNIGYTKNFEGALQKATCDLIAIADQDDIWELDKLASQQKNIGNALIIYHDSALVSQNNEYLNKNISDILNMYQGNDFRALLFDNCVSGHAMLFKKTLLAHIFPFPNDMYYDWWMAIVALTQGEIRYIPEKLVRYRQHEKNVTNIIGDGENKKEKPKNRYIRKQLRIYNNLKTYNQMLKDLERLERISFKNKKDKNFLTHLLKGLHKKSGVFFVPALFFLLIPYRHVLFYSRRITLSKRIRFIIKLAFTKRYDVKPNMEVLKDFIEK